MVKIVKGVRMVKEDKNGKKDDVTMVMEAKMMVKDAENDKKLIEIMKG